MRALVLAMLLLSGASAVAAPKAEETSPDAQVLTAGFLYHHPDLKHRLLGIEAFEEGRFKQAFAEFKRASHWADKAAQAMVAEMLWTGRGTAADQAEAYAWMDLAAERLYKGFLIERERYWAALDDAQRQRAIEIGRKVYAAYGDDVARPRLEKRLERGRRQITGSRVGFVGGLKIMVPGPDGNSWVTIDGTTYYADRYWRPADYFEWQERIWSDPPTGTVEVLPIAADDAPDND